MSSAEQQPKQDKYAHTIPYRFKKGVSGNPSGRPKNSKSMKTWAREYLESLDEDERIEFLNSQNGGLVWQMAEGGPTTKFDADIRTNNTFTEEELEAAKQFIIATRLNKNEGAAGDSSGDKTDA